MLKMTNLRKAATTTDMMQLWAYECKHRSPY